MVDAAFMDGMDYYGTVGISRKLSLLDLKKKPMEAWMGGYYSIKKECIYI